ncbi:hypothetical protein E4T56_gene7691 [Termitomyces sp. T112]|nr:hypothetical protein E4T56_gene7691 [Termitomyces sp. T112]
MSIVSIPFLWDYLANGGSLKHVRALPELAIITSRFFQTYLVSDLVLGYIYYRPSITMLMGWIHHPLYVIIVELSIRRSWFQLFCLTASMEIPTFVLGISTLFPQLRCDSLFAVCFFMTRILLHIVLGILPLHLLWFMKCIKRFICRARRTIPVPHPPSVTGNLTPRPSLSLRNYNSQDHPSKLSIASWPLT